MPANDPYTALMRKEVENRIRAACQFLNAREILVLAMRYGFGEHSCMTLRAIGDQVGVSANRVMQIERNSHRKLRNSHLLDGYLQSGAFD